MTIIVGSLAITASPASAASCGNYNYKTVATDTSAHTKLVLQRSGTHWRAYLYRTGSWKGVKGTTQVYSYKDNDDGQFKKYAGAICWSGSGGKVDGRALKHRNGPMEATQIYK